MSLPFSPGALLSFYARDSGGSRQEISISQQEREFRTFCAQNGYVPGRLFFDAARSGGSTVGRDKFLEMADYFMSGRASEEGIVFYDYTRWARDWDDSQYFLAGIRRKGYGVLSIDNEIPQSSAGPLIESMYIWSASEYRKRLSSDIKRGTRYMLEVHHAWMNTVPPTGYRFEYAEIGKRRKNKQGTGELEAHMIRLLVPDPIKAPLVTRAFRQVVEGRSLGEINIETGLYREISGMYQMLRNRIYTGLYNKSGLHIEGFCPPLVDNATFETVQNILTERRKRDSFNHPRNFGSKYLLSGIVYCASCGNKMIANALMRNNAYYKCDYTRRNNVNGTCTTHGIKMSVLDNAVVEKLRYFLDHPQILRDEYEAITANSTDNTSELERAIEARRADILDLKAQIRRVTDAIASRPDSRGLLDKLTELEQKEIEAREGLSSLEASRPPHRATLTELDEIRLDLGGKLSVATERELQLILRSLHTRVVAAPDKTKWYTQYFTGSVSFTLGVTVTFDIVGE